MKTREIIQCDNVTLQNYMKTDEGIAVSKSPTDDDIVDVKNKNKILV